MPLYEDKHNAENVIKVSQATKDSAVFGTAKVVSFIADEIQKSCGTGNHAGITQAGAVAVPHHVCHTVGTHDRQQEADDDYRPYPAGK